MAGKNARAVKAEKDSGSELGKDFAVQVAPDEEDGDLLGDASRGAHNLWWQERGQREGRGGTIWYQGKWEEEVESLKLKARKEKDQAYGTRGECSRLEWGREN